MATPFDASKIGSPFDTTPTPPSTPTSEAILSMFSSSRAARQLASRSGGISGDFDENKVKILDTDGAYAAPRGQKRGRQLFNQQLTRKETGLPMYSGYLEGEMAPPALNFASQYFNGKASDGIDRFVALTDETYDAFNDVCYKAFLNRLLPGSVNYAVPSMEDIRQVIEQDPQRALKKVKWSQKRGAHESSLKKQKMSLPGIPGAKLSKQI